MNKTAIRNFAVWARNKLIADVSYHAGLLGITKNDISKALPQSTNDVEFYDIGTAEPYAIRGEEIQQRKSLVDAIHAKEKDSNYETAYNSLMEEVAYTWFNRLIAVRFMEVNDYLPEHVRVLSSESGKQEPDIVTTPFDVELFFAEGEQQKIIQMKNDNKLDEVFRVLFIKQCRELSRILPRLFEGTNDYTELLLSLSFIDQEGVVYHLVHDIPEDDFNVEKGGQVEIIGWLYQYYNAELKDETFALLKNNVKVTKERIPSATQLFTPDWIVRYMVENSLGRLWVEGHPNDVLKLGWKYYLDEAEQESSVKEELEKIRSEYAKLNPEDIKVIDPCMGSGHILVYAFDVLMQIYESAGYTQRDAAKSILEHNLFGLDIDDRAAQLAYFAVMMKARQYNRRILDGETNCNVYAIKESNSFDRKALVKLGDDLRPVAEKLLDVFVDAKEYGSIITVDVTLDELDALDKRLDDVDRMSDYGNLLDMMYAGILCAELDPIIRQARTMVQKYDAVITNPPYMNSSGMNNKLSVYANNNYPVEKYDLFAIMMTKIYSMLNKGGFSGLITMESWMFRPSYEVFRKDYISKQNLISMIHMPYLGKGRNSMEIAFGTSAFVNQKYKVSNYITQFDYIRYYELDEDLMPISFPTINERYCCMKCESFLNIPGVAFGYWASDLLCDHFKRDSLLKDVGEAKSGMQTGNNDRFLRVWFEVSKSDIGFGYKNCRECVEDNKTWVPQTKGGDYRKWYGNMDYVVLFKNDAAEIRNYHGTVRIRDTNQYFKEGITWSHTSSRGFGARFLPDGCTFNVESPSFFAEKIAYILGLLNSVVAEKVLRVLNQTMSYQSVDIENVPCLISDETAVEQLVNQNISISTEDWDSFETSWDFKKHPLV